MRRWPVVVVIALATLGAVIAVLPFGRPLPRRMYTYTSETSVSPTNCAAPILSAWRHEPANSGWFGYAPLTSTPVSGPGSCKGEGRRRLACAALLMGPGLLGLFLRRRRFDPPANPQTNPAT
jgi:hypothetical protein